MVHCMDYKVLSFSLSFSPSLSLSLSPSLSLSLSFPLLATATKRDADDFYDYLELLKIMSNFKDCSSLPVLQLVGFNTTEPPHYIMTQLTTHGDLLTYLTDIRQNVIVYFNYY